MTRPGEFQFDVAAWLAREDEASVEITVVPEEWMACPACGAYWGNPDKALDFPNRFKVDYWARCYNPDCATEFYNPLGG
jgi:hypothetical protein